MGKSYGVLVSTESHGNICATASVKNPSTDDGVTYNKPGGFAFDATGLKNMANVTIASGNDTECRFCLSSTPTCLRYIRLFSSEPKRYLTKILDKGSI